jgi:hypothetical protein
LPVEKSTDKSMHETGHTRSTLLTEALYFARMMRGCYGLARGRGPEDPEAAVRGNLERRDDHFLAWSERPSSRIHRTPTILLFRWADCSYEDLGGW